MAKTQDSIFFVNLALTPTLGWFHSEFNDNVIQNTKQILDTLTLVAQILLELILEGLYLGILLCILCKGGEQ